MGKAFQDLPVRCNQRNVPLKHESDKLAVATIEEMIDRAFVFEA